MSAAKGPPVRGIIFDLDGTLYHLPLKRVRLTLRLWRSIGLLKHLDLARLTLRGRTFPDEAALRDAFARELGRLAKVAPGEAARWYQEEFFETFIEVLRSKACPRRGLQQLLNRLRARGVKLAVVSDIGRVEERLRALGIDPEAFDLLMCSEGCGELKPSPHALLTAAQQLGLAPESLLVVGDRADLDGNAARAAKMPCLIVDNRPRFLRRGRHRAERRTWTEVVEVMAARTGVSRE